MRESLSIEWTSDLTNSPSSIIGIPIAFHGLHGAHARAWTPLSTRNGLRARLFLAAISVMLVHTLSIVVGLAQAHPEIELQSRSTGRGYVLCGSCTLPKEISSSVWLVQNNEPGEPLVLSGRIFAEDGVTPDSGVVLFLYQTDAGGYYHRPQENVFHPRIFGWVQTGRDGRYEIRTIKPAPEILTADEPAHIHVHIFGNGIPEHFLHEFWFGGDRLISATERKAFERLGSYSPIVTLRKGIDGILRGVRNIRIRPAPAWKYEEDLNQK